MSHRQLDANTGAKVNRGCEAKDMGEIRKQKEAGTGRQKQDLGYMLGVGLIPV
jgi:hypothetical protein